MGLAFVKRIKARAQGKKPIPSSLLRGVHKVVVASLPKKAGWSAIFRVNAMLSAEQALNRIGVVDLKQREFVMKECLKVHNRKRQLEGEIFKMEKAERELPGFLDPHKKEKLENGPKDAWALRYTYARHGNNSLVARQVRAERESLIDQYETLMQSPPKKVIANLGERRAKSFWEELKKNLNIDDKA
jgi:hypothetical protein